MPRTQKILLVIFCVVLNAAGFAFGLFEPVPLYDELAHLVTPFVLVAIAAEIIYRSGGDDDLFPTPRRAVITGCGIGLLGAIGWEGIEVILDVLGFPISHALPDTLFDVFLGIVGGGLGGWMADRHLDSLFGRSRTDPNRRRVR